MGSFEQFTEPIEQPLWRKTPLIESRSLSKALGCKVLLKLESLQPSGSFKSRGIANFMRSQLRSFKSPNSSLSSSPSPSTSSSNGSHHPHFYSSSGGNAGLACVTAAVSLGYPATVVVPLTTSPLMMSKIRKAGAADVVQVGANWAAADRYLREEILSRDQGGIYVPPFDAEEIWEGHSSIVDEIVNQLGEVGEKQISAVVCSVGGGGLFCGIVRGLDRHKMAGTTVLAVETAGAESLAKALQQGELVTLDGITSKATSLGATRVAKQTFEYAVTRPKQIKSVVVTDAEAAGACVWVAEEERIVVEMACGASVAACERQKMRDALGRELKIEDVLVVVVCGGSNVTLEMLETWRANYGVFEP